MDFSCLFLTADNHPSSNQGRIGHEKNTTYSTDAPRRFPHTTTQRRHIGKGKGKWNLVSDFGLYKHSSVGFYYATASNLYKDITRAEDIGEDIEEKMNPKVSPQG